MDNKCLGCGATLQTIDPKKIGYVKSDILYSEKAELLCERCFNLKHYNKTVDVFINERQFLTNTDKIKKDGIFCRERSNSIAKKHQKQNNF